MRISGLLLTMLLSLVFSTAARSDFEATGSDGRRVLLKDDGTWRYLDSKDKEPTRTLDPKDGAALLRLEKLVDRGNHCRLVLSLTNNLPYEVRNIVPYFSVYRANGALHETVSLGFHSIRPGDKIERSADLTRIACSDIARLQVTGGDRCDMGDLHKFSQANGQCLARIKVAPSEMTRFEK